MRHRDFDLVYESDLNEGNLLVDEVEPLDMALELPHLILKNDNEFLSNIKDHICMIEEGDLIVSSREFDYLDRFYLNFNGTDLSNILNENRIVDISHMNLDDIVLEDFSDEVNEILDPILALDIFG